MNIEQVISIIETLKYLDGAFVDYFIKYTINIFNYINLIAKWLFPVIPVFIALYVFYKQFLTSIKCDIIGFSIDIFKGHKIKLFLENNSILLDRNINFIYLIFDDKYYVQVNLQDNIIKLNKMGFYDYTIEFSNAEIKNLKSYVSLEDFINSSKKITILIKEPFSNFYKINVRGKSCKKLNKFEDIKKLTEIELKKYYLSSNNDIIISKRIKYHIQQIYTNGTVKDFLITNDGYINKVIDELSIYNLTKEEIISSEDIIKKLNSIRNNNGYKDDFEFKILTVFQYSNDNYKYKNYKELIIEE